MDSTYKPGGGDVYLIAKEIDALNRSQPTTTA
jgi:hypothetical protein